MGQTSRFWSFWRTSIGQKLLMAVTGAAMLAWVIGHLAGNLNVFLGREALNSYAEWLHDHPSLLWPTRLGIFAFFLVHVIKGFALWRRNRTSRPQGYRREVALRSSFASRNMFLSGAVLLAFIVFHLLHFTFHATHPEYAQLLDAKRRPDVFQMMLTAFQDPILAGSYVIALSLLALHLAHGARSFMQTLGLSHPSYVPLLRNGARLLTALLVIGFMSIPIAVFVHFTLGIHLPFADWNTVSRW